MYKLEEKKLTKTVTASGQGSAPNPRSKGYYGTDREAEEAKLIRIQKLADEKVQKTKTSVQRLKEELQELKEVYDPDEKEGLAQWFNTDARYGEVRKDLLRAQRARSKPYFGRIDVEDIEDNTKETLYIGKTLIGPTPAEPEVIDWRAPIASVYYDHGLGECQYSVPAEGLIYRARLDRKRTYEIEDDKLKDYYDSDVVANDDLLTKYLSKSKRSVLSEIIATIQDEQNKVIRKNPHHNVLIQGSAGSGKTTVAMHRISYILYNYEKEFKPDAFYIVGSNKVLLNYITGVLPDLDVYGVKQMTMAELFVILLYEDWNPTINSVKITDKKDSNAAVKSTSEWFFKLEEFAKKTEWNHIPKENIALEKNNRIIMSKEQIMKEINAFPEWSMYRKFERLNDVLTSNLETELYGKYYSYSVEEQKKISFKYKNYFNRFIWKDNVFDLYDEFIKEQRSSGKQIEWDKGNPDLYDLAGLAYLYKRIKETEVIQEAGHVVIDEAQDFGMMAYRSLKYCMSKCTFTIMGDVAQNINFACGLGDWEELKELMLPDKYDYFGLLKKSYRNTVEISKYATNILWHATFPIYPVEPIVRHGNEVGQIRCDSLGQQYDTAYKKIDDYCSQGYETVAVICKDTSEAERVYENLVQRAENENSKLHIKLFNEGNPEFGNGVLVLPIEYSKGLEFDTVVIFDASNESYPKEDNYARLLYVAVTRALHELTVLYKGSLTELIEGEVPEERKRAIVAEDSFHQEPRVFEEEFKTKEEKAREQSQLGDVFMKERENFGPRRIVVLPNGQVNDPMKKSTKGVLTGAGATLVKPKNVLPSKNKESEEIKAKSRSRANKSEFNTMPEGTSLSPAGHGTIDNSVKWVNCSDNRVDITGTYGTLSIIPLRDDTVRVVFGKSICERLLPIPDEIECTKVKFSCNKFRDRVETLLPRLKVIVDSKSGSVSFADSNGNVFLHENAKVPRQLHPNQDMWWEYFDWSKKENLTFRGPKDDEWESLGQSARFISLGASSQRPSLLMSDKKYQIMVPEGIKVLACNVPAYGPYIRFEYSQAIDYIVRKA